MNADVCRDKRSRVMLAVTRLSFVGAREAHRWKFPVFRPESWAQLVARSSQVAWFLRGKSDVVPDFSFFSMELLDSPRHPSYNVARVTGKTVILHLRCINVA